MDEDYQKLLFILLRYAQDETLEKIYHTLFKKRKGLIAPLKIDVAYTFFTWCNKYLDIKKDAEINKLKYFLSTVIEILPHTNIISLDIENAANIEDLINIILETKYFLYWIKGTNKKYILHYYSLQDIIDEKKERKSKGIYIKNSHIYVEHKEIEKIRTIGDKININRYKKTYKAIAKALDKEYYCPWCNPREELKQSQKQRRHDECIDIGKFLTDHTAYTDKNLNDHIVYIKGKNITETIELRGKELLRIIKGIDKNLLKNDTSITKEYTEIEKLIIRKYNLKNS